MTGALAEPRHDDCGRRAEAGAGLEPGQHDGQREDDGAEAGSEPVRGGVEVVEDRVPGRQPCDGVEEGKEREQHAEPRCGPGEVPPSLQADPGSLQQPPQPPVFPGGEESRYSLRCSL